jgi:serine/threonine-protein kinase
VAGIDAERWQRLRPLLDRALDLAPADRNRFIADLPADAADLRADLLRLIAEQEQTSPIFNEGAAEFVAPLLQRELVGRAEETLGLRFGAYRVTRLLGVGGMGVVYLAERADGKFSHQVALKVVQTGVGATARERFERERRILARLAHPNIAALHDGGELDDGQSFYTMEYVDGVPITLYCSEVGLDVARRIRLLREVAATLAFAHRNLIVHRDIKPSNILVTDDGQVKLLDFGIAKLLDADTADGQSPALTAAAAAGPMTPDFAAPEQFRNEPVTVATDIYQFGMLCFRVLTGASPYRADPSDPYAWSRAVAEDEPITLSRALDPVALRTAWGEVADAGRVRRQLNRDLNEVVRKCLAKAPADRYGSMDAVCSDLDACLEDRPVSARRASRRYRLARFVQRHRYAVTVAAVALLIVLGAGAFALQQALIARSQASRARHEAEERSVVTSMLTNLLRVGPASASELRATSAVQALDQARDSTLRALQGEPLHLAIATAVFAESYLDLEQAQHARETIDATLSTLGRQRDELRPELLKLDLLLARATTALRDLPVARASLARADAAIAELGLDAEAPQRLAAEVVRLRLAVQDGRHEEAAATAARLLREDDKPGLRETLEFADLLRANATAVANTGDRDAAARLSQRVLDIVAAHYGAASPAALAAERRMVAQDLMGSRRLDSDAILARQEAITRNEFGAGSLEYADVLDLDCIGGEARNDYVRAEAACRKALAIREPTLEPTSPSLANGYHNLADMLLHLKRPAEALALYRHALELRLKTLAPKQQQVISTRLKIAEAQCLTGDFAGGRREFDAAMGIFVAEFGNRHPHEPVYAARYARCLLDGGRRDEARAVLEAHARLDPPRPGMTAAYRDEVDAVWRSLEP